MKVCLLRQQDNSINCPVKYIFLHELVLPNKIRKKSDCSLDFPNQEV